MVARQRETYLKLMRLLGRFVGTTIGRYDEGASKFREILPGATTSPNKRRPPVFLSYQNATRSLEAVRRQARLFFAGR